jgi:phi13 family phage major tail protein
MAAFGAQYICFAPIKSEPDTGLPTYSDKVNLGELVKAELTVNLASGEIYGDDRLVEKVEEFSSGSLSVEVVDMTDEIESKVLGSTYDEQTGLVDKTNDTIPYGGVGYFKVMMRNGVKSYKAYFYPKAKAAAGTDSANTKSSSITLATTPLSFTIYEPNDGDWRYRHTFATKAEAKEWIDSKFGTVTG